ncbi:MAG: hypothetical protein M0Z52_03890 [Actinomycetota bacterium]|nr:hypothetical protein [Actinomycetota bacterium]
MIATTIKARHLDDIEAGVKTHDYRACNAFWKKRIEGKVHRAIIFICGRRIKGFKVKSITVVDVPPHHRDLIEGDKCYAIELGGGL